MKSYIGLLVMVTCTGCATIFGNSSDLITVNTNTSDARILYNGNEMGKGSTSFAVPRGPNSGMLTASKAGCSDRSVLMEKQLVPATLWNILFWPGFIVDVATGSIQKTNPITYTVTPSCEMKS